MALGLSVLRLRFSELLSGDSAIRQLVRRSGWAEHLAAQKKFDEASGEYDRLAGEYPKVDNVQYAYGRFLLASNQEEKAIEAFKREIANNPKDLMAHLRIVDTKFNLKDFAGGLPHAKEVVRLSPRLPLGRIFLGVVLFETGQTQQAITELETARAGLPNEPKIYFRTRARLCSRKS